MGLQYCGSAGAGLKHMNHLWATPLGYGLRVLGFRGLGVRVSGFRG